MPGAGHHVRLHCPTEQSARRDILSKSLTVPRGPVPLVELGLQVRVSRGENRYQGERTSRASHQNNLEIPVAERIHR